MLLGRNKRWKYICDKTHTKHSQYRTFNRSVIESMNKQSHDLLRYIPFLSKRTICTFRQYSVKIAQSV